LLLPILAAAATAAELPTDAEREAFLQQAKILRTTRISTGVTGSLRATLSDGRSTHDAHIQTFDKLYERFRSAKETYFGFRDSYKFNIAAYRLDRLLDLNMVPVSVERKVHGASGAVTWWVDDVLMMEGERHEQGIQPPDLEAWNDQMYQARVFNQLVYNTDPNLGNFLITTDWRLRLIDFTRAFRSGKKLQDPDVIRRIDRRVYRGLQDLNLGILRRETDPFLQKSELKAVMARRDAILDILAAWIVARGEASVICDLPGH
jgi:hypothetical protein